MATKISRRQFLGEASCASVGSASLFSTLLNMRMTNTAAAFDGASDSADGEDYKALVCLFLAGGNDSFNMLVPMGQNEYQEYQAVRSDIALAQGSLLPLKGQVADGRTFGVHPSMPEVQQLYNEDEVAFVANVGTLVERTTKDAYESGLAKLPVGLYSHNDQIAHWQTSVPDKRGNLGWGGRTADLLKSLNDNQNISMNISVSGSNLFQAGQTLTEYAIDPAAGSIGLVGFDQPEDGLHYIKKAAIESMLDMQYQNLFEQTFVNTTRGALDNHQQFSNALASAPALTTPFGTNEISQAFSMVAKTIAARKKLGFKRQTFFILFGGWDHHDEVINTQQAMLTVVSKAMQEFSGAMTELGINDKVTTFTASDFGRTLTSNGRGSDHAWGGNHMVMGGAVKGGQIYGDYPALHIDNPLDTGRGALIPTISCDEYFAELAKWFGVSNADLDAVFPNIGRFYDTRSSALPVGFMGNNAPANPADLPNKQFLPLITKPSVVTPLATSAAAATAGLIALRHRRMSANPINAPLQEKDKKIQHP